MKNWGKDFRSAIFAFCAALLCAAYWSATDAASARVGARRQPQSQGGRTSDDDEVRGLWNDRFRERRREEAPKDTRPGAARKNSRAGAKRPSSKAAPKVTYRREPYVPAKLRPKVGSKRHDATQAPTRPKDTVERVVGVTVWRLRPSAPGDAARMLVQVGALGVEVEMTPVRVEAGTPLSAGDRVRIGIESPTAGYLYVIDREQYANGSLGTPMLIFPTTGTRGGDNRVEAGRLIEIPSQQDRTPFFTVKPSLQRPDQVGELLTIIVSERRLDLDIGHGPLRLDAEQVLEWETQWESPTTCIEQVGGVGRPWTRAEQEAGRDSKRQLVQEEPLPQTIYSVKARRGDPLIVSLSLPLRGAGR